jgi:hypothetical protein
VTGSRPRRPQHSQPIRAFPIHARPFETGDKRGLARIGDQLGFSTLLIGVPEQDPVTFVRCDQITVIR